MSPRASRLRLGLRALTILTLLLFAAQLLLLSFLWLRQERADRSLFALPSANQFVAIVELLESAPADQRDAVLAAVNTSALHVSIASEKPGAEKSDDRFVRRAFLQAIHRYEEALGGRDVSGMIGEGWRQGRGARISGEGAVRAPFPMRLAVMLEGGDWLIVETPSLLDARLRRTPIGLFAGMLGLGIAGLALWTIWGAVRPLQEMAQAARDFSEKGRPSPVALRGGSDLKQLATDFNAMQERIARLMANRSLMLSAMSHDVRTYLTRLRLRVEKLNDADRVAAERTLEDIQALLNDTLAFAEAESGPSADEQIDLASMLKDLFENGAWPPEKVRCARLESAVVRGHESRLRRALMNVIDNGVKYGGEVEISLTAAHGKAMIHIADRGPGIADADKSHIFEPFYRLERSRNRKTEGAGLGLAIAKTIVSRAGGDVIIRDRPGGGAVFEVVLPLAEA